MILALTHIHTHTSSKHILNNICMKNNNNINVEFTTALYMYIIYHYSLLYFCVFV